MGLVFLPFSPAGEAGRASQVLCTVPQPAQLHPSAGTAPPHHQSTMKNRISWASALSGCVGLVFSPHTGATRAPCCTFPALLCQALSPTMLLALCSQSCWTWAATGAHPWARSSLLADFIPFVPCWHILPASRVAGPATGKPWEWIKGDWGRDHGGRERNLNFT